MYKKKPFFVTFEGIEGSGKSYQSRKLYKSIKNKRLPAILTREPGGTKGAEKIRKIILEDYFYSDSKVRFNKYTDTLLYLAARNEHVEKKLRPAIFKKKIIIRSNTSPDKYVKNFIYKIIFKFFFLFSR